MIWYYMILLTKITMNRVNEKSPDIQRVNPPSLKDMDYCWDIKEVIEEKKWSVITILSMDENKESQRKQEDKAINLKFWEQVLADNYLLKKYFSINKKYKSKDIILKSIFINIAIIKNSWIEPKARILANIFKLLKKQDLKWYRKFIYKIFLIRKEKLEKKWFTEEVNNAMFEIAKLFEQLFTNKD